jgi:cytochrome d ubiquinol oxidase subunit I
MVAMGVLLASFLVPAQVVLGDLHGLNTLRHQPVKLAAIEGIWESGKSQPAVLFAIPDEAGERNRFEIGIPGLASYYLTHDWQGYVEGLKAVPAQDRPPVPTVFFGFRAMVGMWLVMAAMVVWAWTLALRGRLYASRPFLRVSTWVIPVGYVAVTAGWITTEAGRQPWVVYGHLRTAEAVTPSLTGGDVLASLIIYAVVYMIIFGAGLYYLVQLVRRGLPAELPAPQRDARPARPISAATHGNA